MGQDGAKALDEMKRVGDKGISIEGIEGSGKQREK